MTVLTQIKRTMALRRWNKNQANHEETLRQMGPERASRRPNL
jgi:hypothetical protein